MTDADWMPVETCPADTVVMTKIEDEHGCRNEQPLVMTTRIPGKTVPMFGYPDKSMYVYYRPTHWRPLTPTALAALKEKDDGHC